MAQITKEARPKAEGVGRTRGRKIKGERQDKGKILRPRTTATLLPPKSTSSASLKANGGIRKKQYSKLTVTRKKKIERRERLLLATR